MNKKMRYLVYSVIILIALWGLANLIHWLWLAPYAKHIPKDTAPFTRGEGKTAILFVHGFAVLIAMFSQGIAVWEQN